MAKYFKVKVKMMHECTFIVKAENETEAHDKPSDDPDCRQIGSWESVEYADEEVDSVEELDDAGNEGEDRMREIIAQHAAGANQMALSFKS